MVLFHCNPNKSFKLPKYMTMTLTQVLVPAILAALRSADMQVRHNALTVLQALTQKLALPSYHKLVHHLAEHKEEMSLDDE